jgi:rhodanese-related sulfurtransferase
MKHGERFVAVCEAARAQIRETDVAAIAARIAQGDTAFHLVDVREDREWEQGHLPGAEHIGRGVIERDIEAKIPDTGAEIVLYCGGGYRSALAAESLQKMGYTNVISMDGGFRAWKDAGHCIEMPTGEPGASR